MYHLALTDSAISDHMQIFLAMKKYKLEPPKRIQYEAINYDSLLKNAAIHPFDSDSHSYTNLHKAIKQIKDKHTVIKSKIQNLPKADWINKDILADIESRNEAWRKFKMDSNNSDLERD